MDKESETVAEGGRGRKQAERGNSAAVNQNNRSVCDTSMKFGTRIAKGIPKRFRYGGIMNFQHGARGSHFSKWPPATTVFL